MPLGIGALIGWFATRPLAKLAASVGLSLIASLVAGGLSRPPVRDTQEDDGGQPETALTGNVLQPGASIPRVMGSQRLFPPLIAEPLVVYEDGQEVVEGVYALAGPHDLEDVRIAGAPVASMPSVEMVIRDGTRRQRQQRLVRRYGFSDQPDIELRGHQLESDGVTLDLSSGDVSVALPQPQIARKVARADEFWLQLIWQQGLHREGDQAVRVPLRVRARLKGETEWRNMPELHYRARAQQVLRGTIRLVWQADAPIAEARPGDGFAEAFMTAPEASSGTGGGWQADATFDGGSGDDRLNANNNAASRLRRIQIDPFEARFYLDPAEWPQGEYEVEILRGHAARESQWSGGSYEISGTVRDLFGWYGTPPRIATNRSEIQDTVTLTRTISVVNETPTPDARVATIAIRARGVRVEQLSVMAHGLVRKWGEDQLAAGDDPRDGDWTASLGATLTDAPGEWLGRFDRAVVVETGSNGNGRALSGDVALPAGLWRFRALVTGGDQTRLVVVRPGVNVRAEFDLTSAALITTAGTDEDLRGTPHARESGGAVECGFDLWLAEGETVNFGIGPNQENAEVTFIRAEISAGWTGLKRSDNPADQFRDMLINPAQAYPARPDDMDEGTILDWRERCIHEGWRCNFIAQDMSAGEALRIVCGAGYARPKLIGQSSVIQDFDRRGEQPVHVFTPRNSRGVAWQQSRTDLPSGLRVTYRDAENERQEIEVWAGRNRDPSRVEAVEYESVQTEAEARKRAVYDLRVGEHRRTVYGLEAPPAAMALLPGSLVEVILPGDVMASGVIRSEMVRHIGVDGDGLALTVEGSGEAFYIDAPVAMLNTLYQSLGLPSWGDASVMADLVDMRRAGLVMGVSIQQADGSWLTYEAAPFQGQTRELRLVDAPSSAMRNGAEVAIRVWGKPERMVIDDITPAPDMTARVVMQPDASKEIWGDA